MPRALRVKRDLGSIYAKSTTPNATTPARAMEPPKVLAAPVKTGGDTGETGVVVLRGGDTTPVPVASGLDVGAGLTMVVLTLIGG